MFPCDNLPAKRVDKYSSPIQHRDAEIKEKQKKIEVIYFTCTKVCRAQGNKRVWVQNATDTKEVQRLLRSGSQTVTLWCMGKYEPKITALKRSAPSIQVSDSESDEETQKASSKPQKKKKLSRHEEKLERVDELMDELKSKH